MKKVVGVAGCSILCYSTLWCVVHPALQSTRMKQKNSFLVLPRSNDYLLSSCNVFPSAGRFLVFNLCEVICNNIDVKFQIKVGFIDSVW